MPVRHLPAPRELADLELLLDGALAPVTGFLTSAERAAVTERSQLPDGSPWRAPITLSVPAELVTDSDLAELDLTDPEGTPIARLTIRDRTPDAEDRILLGGPVEALQPREDGLFRDLRRTPTETRALLGAGRTLAVVVDGPLGEGAVAKLAELATAYDGLVLLPTLSDRAQVVSPVGLVQATLAVARTLPGSVEVVPVPLAARAPADPDADQWLAEHVAARYAAEGMPLSTADGAALGTALDRGEPAPTPLPAEVDRIVRADRPPRHERGLVVLLTGLSGSGKSTVARRLRDLLLERGDRTVTLLDGDVVRRMLSSGLGFSRADRETNVRRIGYVAAEVARHGGIAVCAPIAPYAAVRADLRRMAADAGCGFVLIHVATPLAECERRDRKGLYAKARAGEIAEFTGISDPYEEPTDADLRLDTTDLSVSAAAARVVDTLGAAGWLTER